VHARVKALLWNAVARALYVLGNDANCPVQFVVKITVTNSPKQTRRIVREECWLRFLVGRVLYDLYQAVCSIVGLRITNGQR